MADFKQNYDRYSKKNHLKKDNYNYKLLVEDANDLISVINNNFKIEYINKKAYKKILGYSKKDLIGKNCLIFIHPEDLNEILNKYEKGRQSGEGEAIVRYKKKDNNYVWLELRGKRFIDSDGIPKAIIISRDITEQKKMEIELKESRERYSDLIENILDMIFQISTKGLIEYVSPQCYSIMGYTPLELINTNAYEKFHPEDTSIVAEAIEKVVKKREPVVVDFRFKHKEGHYIYVSAKGRLITINNKQKVTGVLRDITDKVNAEKVIKEEIKKLKELDKIKNNFVDRASHELKTPLNFISFATSLLYDDNKEVFDRKSLNLLKIIQKGTNRLKTLVNDLLNVSMMESKKFEIKLKTENISEILLECLNDILIMVEERDQFLSYDIHEDIFIKVDKIRIEQAILNILLNATKYTLKNGEIYVGLTKKNNGYIKIIIKDSGIGFLEKEKNQLFKKFGKIKRHGKNYDIIDEGSGLGLYIAKEIIELHGGNISLESEGRNKGSTFVILLPLCNE